MTKTDELFYDFISHLFEVRNGEGLIGQSTTDFSARMRRQFPTIEDLMASFGKASPVLEAQMRSNYQVLADAVKESERTGIPFDINVILDTGRARTPH